MDGIRGEANEILFRHCVVSDIPCDIFTGGKMYSLQLISHYSPIYPDRPESSLKILIYFAGKFELTKITNEGNRGMKSKCVCVIFESFVLWRCMFNHLTHLRYNCGPSIPINTQYLVTLVWKVMLSGVPTIKNIQINTSQP